MEALLGFIIAMVAIVLIGKILIFPIKKIAKFILNGIAGAVMLWFINLFSSALGISIGINIFSALIAGFFGIPGVIFLIFINLI